MDVGSGSKKRSRCQYKNIKIWLADVYFIKFIVIYNILSYNFESGDGREASFCVSLLHVQSLAAHWL